MGHSQSSYKTEVYIHTGLPPEIRKISNQQPNLLSKGSRKRTNKAQSQKEGNIKIRAKINKTETNKKPIEKINEPKS